MQNVQKWDAAASDFQKVFELGADEFSRKLIAFLIDNNMLRRGSRVLDIGCGVGRYGTYFAALGCDVTLTDISGGMIEMAKRNMSRFDTPWTALICDFESVSPAHPSFAAGFDLGFSTMCPAVHDAATVRKLNGMVHGWCFIAHFISWTEPLRKVFYEKLGMSPEENMNRFSGYVDGLCTAVRENGCEPQTCRVPYNWSDDRTAEEAAEYLLGRLENVEITDDLRARAVEIARELCNEDGVFRDAVNTEVMWIYWKTPEER